MILVGWVAVVAERVLVMVSCQLFVDGAAFAVVWVLVIGDVVVVVVGIAVVVSFVGACVVFVDWVAAVVDDWVILVVLAMLVIACVVVVKWVNAVVVLVVSTFDVVGFFSLTGVLVTVYELSLAKVIEAVWANLESNFGS